MSKTDKDTSIQELKDLVVKFRDERDWEKHHSPKNLAVSIAIEAAELMELYQWDEYSIKDKNQNADELADILAYSLNLSDIAGIDITTAFRDKLERAAKKYPKEVFNKGQDNASDYHKAKIAYRRNKI